MILRRDGLSAVGKADGTWVYEVLYVYRTVNGKVNSFLRQSHFLDFTDVSFLYNYPYDWLFIGVWLLVHKGYTSFWFLSFLFRF